MTGANKAMLWLQWQVSRFFALISIYTVWWIIASHEVYLESKRRTQRTCALRSSTLYGTLRMACNLSTNHYVHDRPLEESQWYDSQWYD